MPNILSKLTAALLAVLLLYCFPMMQTAKRQEDTNLLTSYRQVVQFVDAVRSKGYLTPEMYNEFMDELGVTMNKFDIEMEHRHKVYQPEYSDPANSLTFTNQITVHYDGYYNDQIMKVLFPQSGPTSASSRQYLLNDGDFFEVQIKSHDMKVSQVFEQFLYGSNNASQDVPLTYGGMVLNEDY